VVLLQGAAVFHLLDTFGLQMLRCLDCGFGGGTVDLCDQNLAIELVNHKSDIVHGFLSSQEFIDERSIGSWPGNTARS
jgi:hypothetical protein